LVDRGREKEMKHLFYDNLGLVFSRQATDENWTAIQISNNMIDNRFHFSYKGIPLEAPLYIYNEFSQQTISSNNRVPNFDLKIIHKIENHIRLQFTYEKENTQDSFAPVDILDYIYSVLHSPTYRKKYNEFLKIDFPKVPYPKDKDTFWLLVKLGKEIRQLHLLESSKVDDYITTYPKGGNNEITTKIASKDWELFDKENQLGRIWINEEQYFDNIPLTAWEFYIGGYQPAQKWLKDRKERTLDYDDILHYQKIIVALHETDRLMKEIDEIEFE